MKPPPDQLYNLLPAIYRNRDFFENEPLRALFEVIQDEYERLDANIGELWNDWFVETCATRFLPYISDLVGVSGITAQDASLISTLRSLIANMTRYSGGKGTAPVLEHAIRDSTGWPACVVEYNRLIASNADLHFIQPPRKSLVDMRDISALGSLEGPFNPASHSINVRGVGAHALYPGSDLNPVRGRYNAPFVGIFIWRLQSYPVRASRPRRIQTGCYTFHPFGINAPLFRQPLEAANPDSRMLPRHVPEPLQRTTLRDELDAHRDSGDRLSFEIVTVNGVRRVPVSAERYVICDLSHWLTAEERSGFEAAGEAPVFLDPQLGRFQFWDGDPEGNLYVSYSYGFSGNIGGGPYSRSRALDHSGSAVPCAGSDFEAVLLHALSARRQVTVVRIPTNETWASTSGWNITLAPQTALIIEAADGISPVLRGNLSVTVENDSVASLTLSGLWIEGSIEVRGGVRMSILDCTVRAPLGTRAYAPDERAREHKGAVVDEGRIEEIASTASVVVKGSGEGVTIEIRRSLTGVLLLPDAVTLSVSDSILDGGKGAAIGGAESAASGPSATLTRATVFGTSSFTEISLASEVIFTGSVRVRKADTGCMRFSFIPPVSHTPVGYECEPSDLHPGFRPVFTSSAYGDPAYGQVHTDRLDMGAFHFVGAERRRSLLEQILRAYVPVDLEPQIFAVT